MKKKKKEKEKLLTYLCNCGCPYWGVADSICIGRCECGQEAMLCNHCLEDGRVAPACVDCQPTELCCCSGNCDCECE